MINLNGIELPSSLVWANEFSQQKVSQTQQRTLSGSIVVFNGSRSNGFPIELTSGSDYGWCKRSVVVQIKELASQSGLTMTLNLKGESFQVMFDHTKGAFDASPLYPYTNPQPDDYYRIKLNLLSL